MLSWKLTAGEFSASGWGANAAECLDSAMYQLEKAPADGTVLPLSFHVMDLAEAEVKANTPIPWACDVCGKPGWKSIGPEGYCSSHKPPDYVPAKWADPDHP